MSIECTNKFFRFHEIGDICEIEILNAYLYCEQLSQCRDLRDLAPHRHFRITGRSSVEAYFCLGYFLTAWGAASLVGIGAAPDHEFLHIDLDPAPAPAAKKWFRCGLDRQERDRVEILPGRSATGRWSPEELVLDVPSRLPLSPHGELCITGRGSVGMYMQLGVSAALAGIKDVFISKPILPYELHFHSESGLCEPCTTEMGSRNGIVIGILGDPNSGKSVFARNFASAIRNLTPDAFLSWIYDCDLAAPTPEWYLDDCLDTEMQRQAIKRPWTPELEARAITDLRILRCNLDLTLADMPGGKRDGENLDRIPSSNRAAMMAECDAFIVLCRQERAEEIFASWRQALAVHHLADRIVAKFISADPLGKFSVSPVRKDENGIWSATLSGLDRGKDRSEMVHGMEGALRVLIHHLSRLRPIRDSRL